MSKNPTDLNRIEVSKKKTFKISIPIPVSLNHMYINTRGGGKRLNKRAEEYMRIVRAMLNEEMDNSGWKMSRNGFWLYADMTFYMPDVRVRDNHNLFKLMFDVMEGYLFTNDYYIMPRVNSVELDRCNPRIDIVIHSQTKKEREKYLQKK